MTNVRVRFGFEAEPNEMMVIYRVQLWVIGSHEQRVFAFEDNFEGDCHRDTLEKPETKMVVTK